MILMKIFIYAAICVFIENICSGIWRLFSKEFTPEQKKQGIMWSYLHMLPVYLIFPILFELFGMLISNLAWYWIILINYVFGVVVITAIETGLGFLLLKIFGFCPWGRYTKEQRGFVGGFSRWDISLSFGLMAILFYYFIQLFNWSVR